MKGFLLTYLLTSFISVVSAQQNTLLLNPFFKDRLFDNSTNVKYSGSSFLPVYESDFNLNDKLKDSSKQYYTLTEILFKKHLFEAKGSNYYITISPVADLSIGKDLVDTAERRLFQNTRGVFVECDLYKNFSFSTAYYENQGRFSHYETDYYSAHCELYPNQSAGKYSTQNAVIPGGGRTKGFKTDGFDYGYAVGNLVYKPHRSIILSAGNTPHFIGEGYRSLLLSDNSATAPYFRATFRFSKKWEFNYMRSRLINLMRRPVSTTVEAYYETKAFSTNYVSYKPSDKISISLFEGILWSKGDSIVSKHVNPMFYNPIPIIAGVFLPENEINSLVGLNLSILPFNSHRIYGQIVIGNFKGDQLAFQIGYRGYNFFQLKNFMLQLEYNNVSHNMYTASNSRLTYSHYNLPLAHSKGNSFQEFILRNNYEWKRIYYDIKSIFYLLEDYSPVELLPVIKDVPSENGFVFLQQIELGYRFNKKMNLSFFVNWQYRSEQLTFNQTTNQFFIGLRTGINNRYNDF